MNNNELKIQEGTLSFWIKEKAIDFKDGKATIFFQVDPIGGSILCVKDDDNKLKVLFVVLDQGRIDVEYDISTISSEKRHMVAFTWSLPKKELNLYFDGQNVVTKKINF